MPRVSQDHLEARRRQILDGARACFARYGYEGATVRRLEQATALSRGAIFHHFRDKESLFLALAEDDANRMADVVAEQGLVQVMRELLEHPGTTGALGGRPASGAGDAADRAADASDEAARTSPGDGEADARAADWLGTRLEVSRRLRTDADFRARWAKRSEQLTAATRARLKWQRDAGNLRDDVDLEVLTSFLELVLEGLVSHLAMGLPADDLGPVLDLAEETVRRHRNG